MGVCLCNRQDTSKSTTPAFWNRYEVARPLYPGPASNDHFSTPSLAMCTSYVRQISDFCRKTTRASPSR